MSIQQENIVFVETEVMDDVPEGGGAATGRVIVDGRMNNVFPDISDLDRAYGRFNLAKMSVAVRTADTSMFGGARTVITEIPDDPALSYTVFTTNDPFDRRVAAAGRVEAYLFVGSELSGYLLENHIVGQRSIQVFQRPSAALPEPGQTLVLKSGSAEQYVRATRVQSEIRQYTYSTSGGFAEYDAAVLTIDLSDALRFNFTGSPPSRTFARATGATALRDVVVADAAKYYGAVRLAQPASIGDMTLRAESIFTRLVPSAQTEIPLVDKPLVGEVLPKVASAPGTVTASRTASMAANGLYVLPTGCWPGTLALTIAGNALTDDGLGNVIRAGVTIGTLNYSTGEIRFNSSAPTASGATTETYRPAASVSQQSYTLSRPVTEATRAYNWVVPLLPLPAPGSIVVAYMAQGRWYELRDNGQGALAGAELGHGSGTVSYVSGTVQVTLGALPDAGSQILISWGTPQEFLQLTDAGLQVAAPVIEFDFGEAISPGTLTLTWMSGGALKTATDNEVSALSGDAGGQVVYGTGKGWLRPSALPDPGSLVATYDTGATDVFGASMLGGHSWSGTLPNAPVEPGSVVAALLLKQTVTNGMDGYVVSTGNTVEATIIDDAAGRLFLVEKSGDPVELHGSSIDYTTGAMVIVVNREVYKPVKQYSGPALGRTFIGYINRGVTLVLAPGGISVRYRQAGQPPGTGESVTPIPGLSLDLTPYVAGTIVPGSLLFNFGGLTYIDRAGSLFHSVSPVTGAGIPAGSINYATGQALLTSWASGSPSFTLRAGLMRPGTPGQTVAVGRTATRPLKSQSLFVTATTLEGETLTAVAQADGSLVGPKTTGSIDIETGIYSLVWGETVGGEFQPVLVDPSTLRYSAVAYSYLPLDADVLGIDPVRLPSDGRVPIFRPGDVVQIMHTATTTGTPALDGGLYKLSVGRTRIAWAKVIDANGAIVTDGYTLDRDLGVLAWESIAGLATPVTVRHTVSDLRQLTDAQITGALSFHRALTHNYPAGESIVSSCLIHGDRRARVSAVWDQQTWNGTWSDSIVGSPATATLNTIAHPITVTNEGAETERWILRFVTSTTAELIGEHVGLVWSGSYTAGGSDIAPINPRTLGADGQGGVPYLTIPGAANGGGWAAGNVVRINTVGAIADFWMARAIQQSDEPAGDGADGCEIYCLGNIDRP